MKKKALTLSILLTTISSLFGQKTDFQTTQFENVARVGLTTKPTIDDYPYLAISILFRNEDKLSDKKFLGMFNKMNFFSTDIEISYDGGRTERCPLYFLKKDKGVFSTTVYKDRTVVRKIPIRKYSTNLPSVNINTDMKIKNEKVAIIKTITDKVAPIIQNPTSIYGAGAAQLCFSFLTDVVSQLNEKKEIISNVGFDVFTTDETGILPYSYKVVILRPNIPIQQEGYTIKVAQDNRLKLFRNDTIFNDYPYFIIQLGLSNFLEHQDLPSIFRKQRGNCNITEEKLNDLIVKFDVIKSKLTDDQLAAEQNLLDLYHHKLIIEEGVASQGGIVREDKLLKAYNALYDFRYKSKEIKINRTLYAEHYKPYYDDFFSCIESTSRLLSIYKFLTPVFIVLDKDVNSIDNSDLGELKNYVENTKTLNFIVKSNFNSNALITIAGAENKIYTSKFESTIKKILGANDLSETVQNDIKKLIDLKSQYDKCSRCQEESQKAESYYNNLVNTEKVVRNQIIEIVANSNDAYSKGSAALDKLNFTIEKTTDSLGNATLSIPIVKADFSILLQTLKENKEKLNSRLPLTFITQNDKTEIELLITKCNNCIKEINTIVDSKLSPLFDKNLKLFSM